MGCSISKDISAAPNSSNSGKRNKSKSLRQNQNHPSKTQLESRIRTVEKTRSVTLGRCKARYAYMTQRGFYPDDLNKPNQDALSVNHKFANVKKDAWLSVYDGHGRHGDRCAQFAAKKLPEISSKLIQLEKVRAWRTTNEVKAESKRDLNAAIPSPGDISKVLLNKDQIHKACLKAHIHCNACLHKTQAIDDTLSGTTSISVYFHGPRSRITVCNVGDSRAILGQAKSQENASKPNAYASTMTEESPVKSILTHPHNSLRAYPLSRDQTPYRKDERIRVKKCGARILSLDQIEGYEPVPPDQNPADEDDDNDLDLGEEIDEYGDPPRVWSHNGEYPGTAFTRSIGDSIAEDLGVFAEPEIITRELSPQDKIVVLASDGVFEFLTNQSVIDICAKFQDPLEACRAVVAEAYELWLQYEHRTDDITILCIFLDEIIPDDEDDEYEMRTSAQRRTSVSSLPEIDRPLRQLKRKNNWKAMLDTKKLLNAVESIYDRVDRALLYNPKTASEVEHISNAIDSNPHFRHISDDQRAEITNILISKNVYPSDVIIQQGDTKAEYLYMVDYGDFEVCKEEDNNSSSANVNGITTVNSERKYTVVHSYHGSRLTNAHPSFGELALLNPAPRDATIRASSDGHLWLLPKLIFQRITMEQNEKRMFAWILCEAFRGGDWLKKHNLVEVTFEEMELIVMKEVEDVTYKQGEIVMKDGSEGDFIYFLVYGSCGEWNPIQSITLVILLSLFPYIFLTVSSILFSYQMKIRLSPTFRREKDFRRKYVNWGRDIECRETK